MTRSSRAPKPLRAVYIGLVLTVLATIAPYVDRATSNMLARHIRDGYPTYTRARVDSAVTAWLVILTVIGAVGVAGWIWTIWAVKTGKKWARWAVTALFVLGTSVALTALLVKDTSGATGLPPLLGCIGLMPCLAGLAAVTALWRSGAPDPPRRTGGSAMKQIRTSIDIDAAPATVWTVLTDFNAYPQWNPVEVSMKGRPVEGSVLEHTAQLPGGKPMTFRPTISVVRDQQELAWKGGLWRPGLFDVLHEFRLETLSDQHTRLHQDEQFRGLLVPLLAGALRKTERGIELANRAIKARAEALV